MFLHCLGETTWEPLRNSIPVYLFHDANNVIAALVELFFHRFDYFCAVWNGNLQICWIFNNFTLQQSFCLQVFPGTRREFLQIFRNLSFRIGWAIHNHQPKQKQNSVENNRIIKWNDNQKVLCKRTSNPWCVLTSQAADKLCANQMFVSRKWIRRPKKCVEIALFVNMAKYFKKNWSIVTSKCD